MVCRSRVGWRYIRSCACVVLSSQFRILGTKAYSLSSLFRFSLGPVGKKTTCIKTTKQHERTYTSGCPKHWRLPKQILTLTVQKDGEIGRASCRERVCQDGLIS